MIDDYQLIRKTFESLIISDLIIKLDNLPNPESTDNKALLNLKDKFIVNSKFKFVNDKYDLRANFQKVNKKKKKNKKNKNKILNELFISLPEGKIIYFEYIRTFIFLKFEKCKIRKDK